MCLGIISIAFKLAGQGATYEQVVTTALSFNSVLHLRELHLREKSMMLLAVNRMPVGRGDSDPGWFEVQV